MPVARERKYTVDTNLFIRAFRDPSANAALQLFHTAFAPFEYLSAVVVQELRAGARTTAAAKALDRHLFTLFEQRGRLLTPSYATWKQAGEVLARLASVRSSPVAPSFVNDVLLALTCRETGVVLVTENRRDFERIGRIVRFDFVDPWPSPGR